MSRLKVRIEKEEAFNIAYDRCTLRKAERFSIYRGPEAKPIKRLPTAARRLEKALGEAFQGEKASERVLVRSYRENSYTNFIVYHEKRTQARLTFAKSRARPKVSTMVFRPAQQDFISYDSETGQVEIEARFEKEEATLRIPAKANAVSEGKANSVPG